LWGMKKGGVWEMNGDGEEGGRGVGGAWDNNEV